MSISPTGSWAGTREGVNAYFCRTGLTLIAGAHRSNQSWTDPHVSVPVDRPRESESLPRDPPRHLTPQAVPLQGEVGNLVAASTAMKGNCACGDTLSPTQPSSSADVAFNYATGTQRW